MDCDFDIEQLAQAIEADAGQEVPGIREALAEVKAGTVGRVTTPEQILAYREQQLSRDIKP